MKTNFFLLLSLIGLISFNSYSQTQFWSDHFEDAGAPSSGARTPSVTFSCGGPSTAYFFRTDLAGIALQSGSYSSIQGTKFWAGEDIDNGVPCANSSISPTQTVDWSSINIAGKTGLSFRGLFAANNTFANNWEGSNAGVNQDVLMIEYRIDAGAWTKIIAFYASAAANSTTLKLETTGDLLGDGADLTTTFTEYTANIAGTGASLDLRVTFSSNNGATEELAVDNFRLFEAPACTNPTITTPPSSTSVCVTGNTSFTIAATGATGYQWQVNTGAGFGNITNGGVYSNATTATLNITGATAIMSGYLYRCLATSGGGACSTTSSQATLIVSNPSLTANSQTNIACFGGNTGAATVNAAGGGISPYTYNWTGTPTGDGTTSITNLTAATWTCVVTDNIGCQASVAFNVTQVPAIVVTPNTQTNVLCFGGSNGAASINTPTGGLGGYTYNWTPGNPTGEGTVSVTGLTAQTYTCTVTDGLGCTKTQNFNVTAPPALVVTPNTQTNVSCFGGSNGAASINTPTGGAGGYLYNWTPGNPTGDGSTAVTGLTAQTYTCTVTDANSCTATQNFNVTAPPALVVTPNTQTNVSCFGGSNGAASINTPTGGAGGYLYNWTIGTPTGDGSTSITGLTAGTWTCFVTDANSCVASQAFNVTAPPALVVTPNTQTNVSCFGGSNGAASINTPTGGAGGYLYNWTPGNPTGDGSTTVSGLTAQTYTCTVTDANSCTATQNFNVTAPPAIVVTPNTQTNVSCFGGSNGAASINTPTGGAGGYLYNWTIGTPTGDGSTSITGLTAGTWTCFVTDANSCVASQAFNVTAPPALVVTPNTQTNVSCFGGSNGAASINTPTGGAGGYLYNWTIGTPTGDGSTSITGLTAGTWTCFVTDANSCVASQAFNVTAPPAISVTASAQTNVSCFGGSNGAASINTPTGGAGGYTYNWTPGTPTGDGTTSVTGLSAGTWTCTVTDVNGCTATQNFNVTAPTAIVVTPSMQVNVACFGGATGAASINTPTGGAGGYLYNWTPGTPTGDGTTTISGLTAGTWTCTVTDANSCTATQNFNITAPPVLAVTPNAQTNVSCFGGSNGAASVNTPTGGAGGYMYDWTPGTPTGDGTTSVTGLSATTYTCTVTDANSCTTSQAFTLTAPTALSVTASAQTNVACFGGTTGAASINTPTGGAGGYTYDWAPGTPTGDGTISVTGLTAGTWTCTVTDVNGCTATQNFNVTSPTAITASISSTQTGCTVNNGTASVSSISGGAGGYTYDWAPGTPTGDGTTTITGLGLGTYTCTITDINGCSIAPSVVVTTIAGPSLTAAAQTNVACFGGATGAASVNTATGGAGGYSYDWTPGTPTGDGTTSITGLTANTYTCTVTDLNGCTASQAFTITAPTALAANAAVTSNYNGAQISCFGAADGVIAVTPSGGAGGYNYDWSPGTPTGDGTTTITGLIAGNYSVLVTDANGCSVTSNVVTLTQPMSLTATLVPQTNVSCFGGSNGTASIFVIGGTGFYTYDWSPGTPTGDGTNSVSGLTAGMWSCNVTDVNGCVLSVGFFITEPSLLVLTAASETDVTCGGASDGTAAVNAATGGAGGYTYDWTPGTPTGDGTTAVTGLAPNTYTCTVTDQNGCTAGQVFTITEAAPVPPTAVCQNITVYLDASGNASIVADDIDGGSTTTCGSIALSASQTAFTCADIGTNTVTLTVTGDGGTATCSATLTVADTIAPSASNPANLQVECIDDAIVDVTDVTGETDNCGTPTVTFVSDVSDGQTCPETITRTYNVADAEGNSMNVTQMIIIHDMTPPTATNPVTLNAQCPSDVPVPLPSWVSGEVDNCSPTVVSWVSDQSNGLTCPETITRTFSVTDVCNNSINVTQSIIVLDTQAPIADVASLPELTGNCDLTPPTATASDNCAGTLNGTPDVAFPITAFGTTTVTWTYVDDCGNVTTQTQDVTLTPIDVTTHMANDGITFVVNNLGQTYQWIDCNTGQPVAGATNHNFTPTYGSDFAVIISQNGCSDTSTCINSTVGIGEVGISSVMLYPNPTDGMLFISFEGVINNIEVVDMLGRVISAPVSIGNKSVDATELAPGKYMIRITTESNQILLEEFVVQL
ncbi:MAG: T9SS type A sorting domain-containing protein [Bacteroidota bacterium]